MSEIVGLLPAAGRGSRLGPIPCSKEIMPLGFQPSASAPLAWQPVTAIETHLNALHQAGARRAVVIIGESKADVVRYVGDGSRYGLATAYVYQQHLRGMPFALSLARPWIGNATTLFSMPDTLITPRDTVARLAEEHRRCGADVTLGLFPTATPQKFGMVAQDVEGRIVRFVDKPAQTDLTLMWGMAAWSPRFADFLDADLAHRPVDGPEVVLSDVFAAALADGLVIRGTVMEGARYHDIGTPEDFQSVVLHLALGHPQPASNPQ
ncbi:MAG: sugar phosphate nucleotidyltransferase [Chloroflexales bacterium]